MASGYNDNSIVLDFEQADEPSKTYYHDCTNVKKTVLIAGILTGNVLVFASLRGLKSEKRTCLLGKDGYNLIKAICIPFYPVYSVKKIKRERERKRNSGGRKKRKKGGQETNQTRRGVDMIRSLSPYTTDVAVTT